VLTRAAESAASFGRRDAVRLMAVSSLVVLLLGGILSFNTPPSSLPTGVGDIAPARLLAPQTVSFESAVLTKEAQDNAQAQVPFQYDFSPERAAAIAVEQATAFEQAVAPLTVAFAVIPPDQTTLASALPALGNEDRATLLGLSADRWAVLRAEATRVLAQVERTELRDTELAATRAGLAARMLAGLSGAEQHLAAAIVAPLVVPNSSYSESLTISARAAAAAAVKPQTVELRQGQVIIEAGHVVTALDMEEIAAAGLNTGSPDPLRLLGWFAVGALLIGFLFTWVQRFRPEFWHRGRVLLLLAALLVLATALLRLTADQPPWPHFLPLAAAGLLVAVLLDTATATVVLVVVALLAGAADGGSLELATYVLIGGMAGAMSIHRGEHFRRFVTAGAAMAAANILVVGTFALLNGHDLFGTAILALAAIAAAIMAAIVAAGTFALLGGSLGLLTAFQLLELANPTHPLMRRLLLEAPGTYHHALMVGNLAERAAELVGADPLLARVAAYYHDVGKLANPAAFIENQAGGENIHDRLSPEVSARLIRSHVADGIDIAYAARLPRAIIAFIPQHHGTAIMGFFHTRAREQAAAPVGGLGTPEGQRAAAAVNVDRFRHAGPKPQTRVAAILMLADGVEAAVRSMSDHSEVAIRAMVARIIERQLADGQLDECDLTLRDLHRIRDAFTEQLQGIYHQRVAYPEEARPPADKP
jgi:hypothetical protein